MSGLSLPERDEAPRKERPILFSAPKFAALVSPEPNTGCWLWLGAINAKGYGRFGSGEMAHRAALRLVGRIVPGGMEVDHRCRVRSCVNPDHLDMVTHGENITRKPVPPTCPAGHDPSNLRTRRGKRHCRACDRERSNRAYVPRAKSRRRRAHLTDEERTSIRELLAQGLSHSVIAPRFNVSVATVSRVRNAHA